MLAEKVTLAYHRLPKYQRNSKVMCYVSPNVERKQGCSPKRRGRIPHKIVFETECIRHLAPENLILETNLLLDHNLFLSPFYCKKKNNNNFLRKEHRAASSKHYLSTQNSTELSTAMELRSRDTRT